MENSTDKITDQDNKGLIGYRLELGFPAKVFADEVGKYRFLQLASGSVLARSGWIAAFALLDERFVLAWTSEASVCLERRKIKDELELLGQQYLEDQMRKLEKIFPPAQIASWKMKCRCRTIPFLAKNQIAAGWKGLAAECIDIHLLPVRDGRVHRYRDYWWCSIQNYLDVYSWPLVNTEQVLELLLPGLPVQEQKEVLLQAQRRAAKRIG